MPARPGPKPSLRCNEVKVLFSDAEFQALMVFKDVHGIPSNSEGVRVGWVRHVMGVLGSVPALAAMCNPSRAISGQEQKQEGGRLGRAI